MLLQETACGYPPVLVFESSSSVAKDHFKTGQLFQRRLEISREANVWLAKSRNLLFLHHAGSNRPLGPALAHEVSFVLFLPSLTMNHASSTPMLFWLVLALAIVAVIGRGLWLYRASLTWPTADGAITRLGIEWKRDAGIAGRHYFCATFTYDFQDANGHRHCHSGTWYKNFSTESEARDFAARELPVGKPVVVRFNPKNPAFNDLELGSWSYTNDRPTSLNI
jgi:Protein of unknown function (DUF3592)